RVEVEGRRRRVIGLVGLDGDGESGDRGRRLHSRVGEPAVRGGGLERALDRQRTEQVLRLRLRGQNVLELEQREVQTECGCPLRRRLRHELGAVDQQRLRRVRQRADVTGLGEAERDRHV